MFVSCATVYLKLSAHVLTLMPSKKLSDAERLAALEAENRRLKRQVRGMSRIRLPNDVKLTATVKFKVPGSSRSHSLCRPKISYRNLREGLEGNTLHA